MLEGAFLLWLVHGRSRTSPSGIRREWFVTGHPAMI
jgi:hypothetical protein